MKSLLLPLILAAALLSGILGDNLRGNWSRKEELPLPPNVEFLKKWSFGLSGAAAMGYWLRFLSEVGGWLLEGETTTSQGLTAIFSDAKRSKWMERYLRGIIDVAPEFEEPYLYGGIMFYWYGNAPEIAESFLETAWERGSMKWEVPFYLGLYAYKAARYDDAAMWMERAARNPASPTIAPFVASSFAARAGEVESAVRLLEILLLEMPPGFEAFRPALEADLALSRQLIYLNGAAGEYERREGESAWLPYQLVRAGLIESDDLEPVQPGEFIFSGGKIVFRPEQEQLKKEMRSAKHLLSPNSQR